MTHGLQKKNTILCIMGRKESGKSTLALEIIEEFPRVFVLDTNAEYGEEQGFEVADTFERSARRMAMLSKRPGFRLSLRDKETTKLVNLLDVAYEVPDSLVVIEETHFYCSPARLPDPLSRLVRMGRHRNISQVYISQRPAGLNRNLTSQADFIISFRQHEARDVKWFEEYGDDADSLRDLPDYRVKVWTFGKPEKLPLAVAARIHEPRGRVERAPGPGRLQLFDLDKRRSTA